jgi:hypothetical protein
VNGSGGNWPYILFFKLLTDFNYLDIFTILKDWYALSRSTLYIHTHIYAETYYGINQNMTAVTNKSKTQSSKPFVAQLISYVWGYSFEKFNRNSHKILDSHSKIIKQIRESVVFSLLSGEVLPLSCLISVLRVPNKVECTHPTDLDNDIQTVFGRMFTEVTIFFRMLTATVRLRR